jgi:hypothetical protein
LLDLAHYQDFVRLGLFQIRGQKGGFFFTREILSPASATPWTDLIQLTAVA